MIKYTNWFLALALSACTVGAMIPAAMADTAGGNVEAEAVSTSSLPIENRIKAYNELVRKINADKNADKNIILDKGLELLASPDLKDANQQKQVRRTVLDNARKYNQNVLEKLSREIVADVNAGMDLRIAANRDLINIEFNSNNIDAAKKAAESAIAWANQTPDNIAENYKNYGDLLFMNNECDAAVKIYRKMGE